MKTDKRKKAEKAGKSMPKQDENFSRTARDMRLAFNYGKSCKGKKKRKMEGG